MTEKHTPYYKLIINTWMLGDEILIKRLGITNAIPN